MDNRLPPERFKDLVEQEYSQKEFALMMALYYWEGVHRNPKSNPTSPDQVMKTAQTFYQHLYHNRP